MEASDLFRRLNALTYGAPRFDHKCALCGTGSNFACSACVQSLIRLSQKTKLQMLIVLRKLDKDMAKFFERTFHCHKLEDAETLKKYRKTKGWTREQAAMKLKLPKSEISAIEKGDRTLPSEPALIIKKDVPLGVVQGSDSAPLEAA